MEEKEARVILFGMETDGDLRIEYPELAEMPEFQGLKVKEVRLSWLLGNRTSPIYRLSKKERLIRALEVVYGSRYAENKDVQPILEGNMPAELRTAIEKMEKFNPEYRLMAKLMSEYVFNKLNDLIVLSPAEEAAMDIDEKKKYTDLVIKISSELPSMVARLETSYGAKTVERKTNKKVLVNINDVLG